MNENRSVATIDAPEFINIKPFNPLISQCQIKVLYIGKNRNGSYIDKNTAIQMANSLPCTPIVGAWRQDIEDFGDHGHVIKIEDGEVKFSVKTVPYGFVAPDARVWFQKFNDTDSFGNEVTREYLMTTGYLWTGQYEEAISVVQEGKGQSMELDEGTLDGKWARDSKDGVEFFIINDALFSKLCILGDDVEPCFEGASITAVNGEYSTDADFAYSLYSMIKELKDALAAEGGLNMPKNMPKSQNEFTQSAEAAESVESAAAESSESVDAAASEESSEEAAVGTVEEAVAEESHEVADEKMAEEEEGVEEVPSPATKSSLSEDSSEFTDKKKEDVPAAPADKKKSDDEQHADDQKTEDAPIGEDGQSAEEDEKKKVPPAKNSLADDGAIMKELEELRAFKLKIENERKDAVINKYHMLSDEDKAEVIAHKSEYSVEQIDEKLALVYVRKNVNFDTVDGKPDVEAEPEPSPLMSFSLDDSNNGNVGEAIDAVQEALREVCKF